jgi:S-adenosylmethionine-diacylgycerolhomoserine-N-methlytransferase
MQNAFEQMNSMYRYQRYFYNATRKYYLLGRDRLISQLPVRPGSRILEVGCGTSRNLIILAERNADANFFGLDASSEMLKTAGEMIGTRQLTNISLRTALADDFSYSSTFGLERPFDTIFFSYSITMIPTWKESITTALLNLSSGGCFYIVDFYDQKDLPQWFGALLRNWLKRFHVQFWQDLMPYLEDLERCGLGKLEITPIARRYAFLARFEKAV